LRESNLSARFASRVKDDLARIRVRTVEDLLAYYWIGGRNLEKALRIAPLNTDDNMLIEFAAPLQILAGNSTGPKKPLAAMFDNNETGALAAIQLDPATDPSQFWARVGEAALRLNAYREAALYAEASLQISSNAEAAQVLARAWAGRGERARALAILQQAEESFPRSTEILRALAQFHSLDARWLETRTYAERILEEVPDDPIALLCLGRTQFHLNEASKSRATLEKIPLRSALVLI